MREAAGRPRLRVEPKLFSSHACSSNQKRMSPEEIQRSSRLPPRVQNCGGECHHASGGPDVLHLKLQMQSYPETSYLKVRDLVVSWLERSLLLHALCLEFQPYLSGLFMMVNF